MRVTAKGQVTIPKDVRDKLGIRPGSEVAFVERGPSIHLVRADTPGKREAVEAWLAANRGQGSGKLSTDQIMELTRGPFDDVDSR